jgi:hypothetical protein
LNAILNYLVCNMMKVFTRPTSASDFFLLNLVFSENKTVRRLKKCKIVDLLRFFKNETTKIRHLGLRRHFEFYQKSSSMIFLYIDPLTKRRRFFLGIYIFEKLRAKSSFHCLLKYRRHLGFFPKNLTDLCSEHKNLEQSTI